MPDVKWHCDSGLVDIVAISNKYQTKWQYNQDSLLIPHTPRGMLKYVNVDIYPDLTPASGEIAIIIPWHGIFNIWIVGWKDRMGIRLHGQILQLGHYLCMLWQVQGLLFIGVPEIIMSLRCHCDFEKYTNNQT